MNTTLSRLLLVALSVAAFVGSTSSASAATWGPNDSAKLVADAGSTLRVVDHETFGADEVITSNFSNTVFAKVTPSRWSTTTILSRCAGGEVRADLKVEVGAYWYTKTITGRAQLYLYEGSDCSRTDLDGMSEPFRIDVAPGQTQELTIPVSNTAEGGDSAVAKFTLRNVLSFGQ